MSEQLTAEHKITEPARATASRDELLSSLRAQTEVMAVKHLGGKTIKIRQLSAEAHQEINAGAQRLGQSTDMAMFNALTIVKGVVEPELKLEDVAKLKAAASGAIVEISNRIWIFSGVVDDAETKAKNG